LADRFRERYDPEVVGEGDLTVHFDSRTNAPNRWQPPSFGLLPHHLDHRHSPGWPDDPMTADSRRSSLAPDVVELNPVRDPSGMTAMVAARIAREIAGVMLS
jgi:hypothetical protein